MNINELPLFDLIVIGIIALSLLLGLLRGLVQEILSLFSWGSAGLLAWFNYPLLAPWLEELIYNNFLRNIAAAVLAFVISIVILNILANIIGKLANSQHIRGTDRALGTLFGLVRGYIICAGLLAASYWLWEERSPPDFLQEGKTLPYVAQGAVTLVDLLSHSQETTALSQRLREYALGGQIALELHQKLLLPDTAPQSSETNKLNDGYDTLERKELDQLFQSER